MPNNKYLYLSSINSPSAADFQVNLPENLIIQPYSEVRAVSVRINPNNNVVVIDKNNNNFYIGVDNWNKETFAVPLMLIKMDEGEYLARTGSGESFNLDAQINSQIKKSFKNYCFVRNGQSVSLANSKLTFKMNVMEMYGVPGAALSSGFLELFPNLGTIGGIKRAVYEPSAMTYNNAIFGINIQSKRDEKEYFLTPPLVSGLTTYNIEDGGNSAANAPIITYFEINETLEHDFKMYISMGFVVESQILNQGEDNFMGNLTSDDDVDDEERFNFATENFEIIKMKVTQEEIIIKSAYDLGDPDDSDDNGEDIQINFTAGNKLKFTHQEYENNSNSFVNYKIEESADNGNTFTTIYNQSFKKRSLASMSRMITKFKDYQISKRMLVEFKGGLSDENIKFAFAADDINDQNGYNRHTAAYGGRAARNINIPNRLLSIIGLADGTTLEADTLNQMKAATTNDADDKFLDSSEDFFDHRNFFGVEPNAGLTIGMNEGEELNFVAQSYTTGVVPDNIVDLKRQMFPQYYLDIPTLPLGNLSANPLQGQKNTFVCPIDLSTSETNSNLYTSQLYTMNYNQLTNSYPLNINTLKVRICNIDGTVADGILNDTIVCLEIRDNPDIKNDQMIVALRNIEQNYTPGSQTGDFRKDQ
tara:strand:+ start:3793 stop:5730 length:1938 start_codon:yes stop_codon:yes gene_type:complete